MKTSSFPPVPAEVCSTERPPPRWALRLAPGLEFDARAARARAGLVNLLVGTAAVLLVVDPGSWLIPVILAFLLYDMTGAVVGGLAPSSPLGVAASVMVRRYGRQPTPHLPKRFAWSMGAMLAAGCLTLQLLPVPPLWPACGLGVFFALSWLDAVVGFCAGCWIYFKLFGCSRCRGGGV